MSWMDWIAHNHPVFVHVPVAVAILLPFALIAAQRVGRGIRPWWVTCRYLAWGGTIFATAAILSGFLLAKKLNLLAPGQFLAPKGTGDAALFRLHQALGASSFVLAILTLKSVFRNRGDHQGLGFLPLVLGLAWAAASLGAGWFGGQLGQAAPAPVAAAPAPVKAEVEASAIPSRAPDPEASAPLRALDYQSLVPMHAEPVRNPLHGNRWIRVWVSPGAEEAYRSGQPLPEGSFLVMNSLEDRWGRPGVDAGPLYAMEIKGGKPRFTFYWPRVPAGKRGETAGAERAYWRGDDPNLASCMTCHLDGLALKRDRSAWVVPKKPKAEAVPAP
jgi:uncharacterized membrane protein